MKTLKASLLAGVVALVACASAPVIAPASVGSNPTIGGAKPAPPPSTKAGVAATGSGSTAAPDSTTLAKAKPAAKAAPKTGPAPPPALDAKVAAKPAAAKGPSVLVGNASQNGPMVVRGVDGRDYTFQVGSPFASLGKTLQDLWLNTLRREYAFLKPHESIQFMDGSVIGPINPDAASEAANKEWNRTHTYFALTMHLSGEGDPNPLKVSFDANGKVTTMCAIELVMSHQPKLNKRNIKLRPMMLMTYADPGTGRGRNVALLFRWSNRIMAKWALVHLVTMNVRVAPTVSHRGTGKIPADTKTQSFWDTGVTPFDGQSAPLLDPALGGKAEVTATFRRSNELKHWRPEIVQKIIHNNACTQQRCNPGEGHPEVKGNLPCYQACGVRFWYDFNAPGAHKPEHFFPWVENGERTKLKVSP